MSDLVYVSDADPGITRRRCGRGFSYLAPDGTTIARGPERTRIEALAVPPAYEDVWICPRPNGHLQATGRDARRRKQYRYHPDWTAAQAETKFDQLADFGAELPKLRARLDRDLAADPGDLEFALAAAVTVLDRTALRVGRPEYATENGSYGALTLRPRHVSLRDEAIQLKFTAKGGKRVRQTITDRKLMRMLQQINDIPGATVLSWVDDDGTPREVKSEQLNNYLADICGAPATAKTFRTWAGTLAAFERVEEGGATIGDIAKAAAERLHNTPTVARNSYIHPAVIDLTERDRSTFKPAGPTGLRAAERRLMGVLT